MLIEQFAVEPIRLLEIHARDARQILAARSWCILRRAGHDPLPRLQGYLLSQFAATRFALLMETVTQIWPEPFAIHRPCCPTASIDEAMLIQAVRLANLDARPEFEALLREMIPLEARDLLFARACGLYEY